MVIELRPRKTGPGVALSDYDARSEAYPSALDSFDQMMNMAKGKRIVMFLDYDGTLSPIVDDPDLAFMSEAVIKLSSILIPRNTFPTTDIFHKVISLLAYLVCTLLLKIIEFVLAIVKQMRSVVSEVANNFPT
ncbi:hypothetical protein Dimus_001238, partial [Dionaea muscipula]